MSIMSVREELKRLADYYNQQPPERADIVYERWSIEMKVKPSNRRWTFWELVESAAVVDCVKKRFKSEGYTVNYIPRFIIGTQVEIIDDQA